ncbi:DNA-binding SARP family transcriptional activator [Kitasatospora sp. MAA4]|nr:DNA-binding SARP family transcriptional activator [Kitasatospora sp. MAA4]
MIRILGPVCIETAGVERAPASVMVRGALTALSLDPGTGMSQTRLLELLWDEPPASANANLRQYVSRLRKELLVAGRGVLSGRRAGRLGVSYQLDAPDCEVDHRCFAELVRTGRRLLDTGYSVESERVLGRALALWRGPAGVDAAGSARLRRHLAAFDTLWLQCREDLAEAALYAGPCAQAVLRARSVIADHPLRERPWAVLMAAHHSCGELSEALAAYQEFRRLLRAELGVEPSRNLASLQSAVLNRSAIAVQSLLAAIRTADLHAALHSAGGSPLGTRSVTTV